MFLSRMFPSPRLALGGLAAMAVTLLAAGPAAAQAPRRPLIPADAKAYQRLQLEQEYARRAARPKRAGAEPTFEAPWKYPAGAPARGTYTWYAPPSGYKVIREATPSAPQEVTVVGPDGTARTFKLVGPILMRLRYVAVRDTGK
jgi:hypothetical protein